MDDANYAFPGTHAPCGDCGVACCAGTRAGFAASKPALLHEGLPQSGPRFFGKAPDNRKMILAAPLWCCWRQQFLKLRDTVCSGNINKTCVCIMCTNCHLSVSNICAVNKDVDFSGLVLQLDHAGNAFA
jgi:hypothetical protein